MTTAPTLHRGHVLEVLPALTEGAVRTCVTSPPYWGLRDYGLPPSYWPEVCYTPMPGGPELLVEEWDGCLGLESDPFAFVAHLVAVFRAVRRVLAEDGTLWLNLGDSWTSGGRDYRAPDKMSPGRREMGKGARPGVPEGLKPKDLLGIPWRVAMALQADGWWLRSEVIWHKPNPMPESVRDRPTKAHEQVFLLSKSERYFYDAGAIAEPASGRASGRRGPDKALASTETDAFRIRNGLATSGETEWHSRNKRSVWTIPTQPFGGAHFATMPPELARLCIRAGSAPGDVVLDPFSGAGTTGLVAGREGRGFVGVELSEAYCHLARGRWREDAPLLMSCS